MQKQFSLLALFVSVVAGCGGEDTQTSGTTSSNVTNPTEFSVTFAAQMVNPGEEGTRCIEKRLTNKEAMYVNQIRNTLNSGSHHLIVYRTTTTEEKLTPFDCEPFTNLLKPESGIPLMITQTKDDLLELPEGVGFSMEPGQMVRLEMHYINPTSSPIEVKATSTFYKMPEAEFKYEADFAMFANTAIDVPPLSQVTTDPLFLALPPQLETAKFFAFTGHVHEMGTSFKISTATTKDGPDTVIYDPQGFVWSEPPTEYFNPPIELPAGGGFRFQCAWNNTTPEPKTFGESAKNEMCLFYSYYYPAKGAVSCAYTDKLNGGTSFCCPGSDICSLLP
jgi:hypothetical protein